MGQAITRYTIWLALGLYSCVILSRRIKAIASHGADVSGSAEELHDSRDPGIRANEWSMAERIGWLLGAVFAGCHVLAAMHVYHQWSHQRAYQHVTEETQRLLGVELGWGIYVNYVFILVWILDATVPLLLPTEHQNAYGTRLRQPIHGFIGFIVINGAIVFTDGVTRWIGLAVLAVWLVLGIPWNMLNKSAEPGDQETFIDKAT